jgi:hypothetical protein
MEVSCPQCKAFLLLPTTVVGQAVSCPSCRSVLRAESGRLVMPQAGVPTEPVTRPAKAYEEFDEGLDVAMPAPVHAGANTVNAMRGLNAAGRWLRIAAVVNIAVLLAAVYLNSRPLQRPGVLFDRDFADVLSGALCLFGLIGPFAVLMWVAGGRLRAVQLQGTLQQFGVLASLFMAVVVGSCTLFASAETLAHRGAMGLVTILLAMTASGLTLFATIRASLARRTAIRARLHYRLADVDTSVGGWPRRGSPQQLARSGARSLRLAAGAMLVWNTVSCLYLAAMSGADPNHDYRWLVFPWLLNVAALGMLFAGAHYLQTMSRRGIVHVAIAVALVLAIGFGLFAVHEFWTFGNRGNAEALLSGGIAIIVSLCSAFAAINSWHAVRHSDVRRAFRD